MWLGTAEWFGIKTDEDLDKVLPMHKNFDSSLLYAESELFVVSETATAWKHYRLQHYAVRLIFNTNFFYRSR